MAYYRLYQLRGPKNRVETFHEFDADDDLKAIARGETYRRFNSMELWSGHRKVRRWEGVHDCETLYENQPSLPNARRSPRDLDERWDARGENSHVGVFPDSETSRTV